MISTRVNALQSEIRVVCKLNYCRVNDTRVNIISYLFPLPAFLPTCSRAYRHTSLFNRLPPIVYYYFLSDVFFFLAFSF